MKVCKYCDSKSQDNVVTCANCGASDFIQVCSNCRTVYDGEFCPGCGVRAGTKAKHCPNCGATYFSAACPDCGYVRGAVPVYPASRYSSPAAAPAPTRKKPRKTWLWVLGWIFMFPLPLTILLVRSEKVKTFWKVVWIILAWAVYYGAFGS